MSEPEPAIHVVAGAAPATPAVIGVPFPEGAVRQPTSLGVSGPDGKTCPGQARTLVAWPDGSTRWALLSFTASCSGQHTVRLGGEAPTNSSLAVLLCRDDGSMTLQNGFVSVVLSTSSPGPISLLEWLGRTILADAAAFQLVVDDASSQNETTRTLQVLEEGPVRVRARALGAHYDMGGRRKMTYRLDVELWAGLPAVRLDYQFFQVEPGGDFLPVDRIGVDLNLALDASTARRQFVQSNYDEFYVTRDVLNPDPVAIVTDNERSGPHVEDSAMLLDDIQYAAYLAAPLVSTPPWLGVIDSRAGVYVHVQDMCAMQPKRLHSEGTRLGLDVWPRRAGTLQLQQGRSRRHVMSLSFTDDPPADRDWVARTMGLPFWEGRACVEPAWLAHCGEFEQDRILRHGSHVRFEKWLRRLVNLEMSADMFDLGDTPDSGYNRSYAALGMHWQPRVPGAPAKPRVFSAPGKVMASRVDISDYEPVWTNNEYDAIHAFGCELMRTGRHDLWDSFRWQVRHNIEVDFTHYADQKWLCRVPRVHSARHTTSGGYPSHFWTEGLLKYYCLTGDPDVLEVAVVTGDAVLRFFHDPERGKVYGKYDREMGWALLAMAHLWDITRELRFEAETRRLVRFFVDYHEQHQDTPLCSRVYVTRFYFLLNLVEAVDLFARRTGDDALGKWLVRTLEPMPEAVLQAHADGESSRGTAAALAIAYERTGDVRFLRAGLPALEELIADTVDWQSPVHEAKPMAILYREFIRFFGQTQRAGLLDQFEYPSLRGRKS